MTISIGNYYSTGGKNVLGGTGGSGLDTKTLIEALVAAKQVPVKALQDKITVNDTKNTAFSEYKSLLGKFKDATDLLRNVPGFAKSSSNAFEYAKSSITSNTDVAGSNYLSVTVEPGTAAQSYTINEIHQIAKATKQSTDTFTVDDADTAVVFVTPDPGYFKAGTFTLNGTPITLAATDTLNVVAAKFNAVTEDTGVTATVVKIANGSYKLQFSATATGLEAGFDLKDSDYVTDATGVLTLVDIDTTQPAQNAQFKLDGSVGYLERETNTVDDLIHGVTFNLQQATPALTELEVAITPDNTVAKNAIIGFVNAYNDIKIFAAKQTAQDSTGAYTKDAVLATSSTLRASLNSINNELTASVGGLGADSLKRLSDLGITFTDLQETADNVYTRNVLTVDDSKLDSALSAKFNEVRKVFEFSFTSNNANLTAFSRTNALTVSAFTLTVNPGTTTYQATYTDTGGSHTLTLDATPFTSGNGYTLKGRTGTALEGLTLLYGVTTAGTATVTLSQGLGDRLYNLADNLLKESTGVIAIEQESLKTGTEKFQEDIERLTTQIEVYRQQLLEKFSQLEQTIAQVNSLLTSLDANSNARNNS